MGDSPTGQGPPALVPPSEPVSDSAPLMAEGTAAVPPGRAMTPLQLRPGSQRAASSTVPAGALRVPLPLSHLHQQAVWEASFYQWSAACRFLQNVWPLVIRSILSRSCPDIVSSDRLHSPRVRVPRAPEPMSRASPRYGRPADSSAPGHPFVLHDPG